MKTIRINFTDFWPGFDRENFYIVKFLKQHYDIQVVNDPDYIFFSNYGDRHLNYDRSIRIYITGENIIPDFNFADYAIGYNLIDFGDRFLRYPYYLFYGYYQQLQHKVLTDKDSLLNRKFCNFIYSNDKSSDPVRNLFFHELMKYKKVDSGGNILNNIGYRVHDKIKFISDYKFTIAFENSSLPGYTTEKLTDPMLALSMPVYYGNPAIALDFNTESFIVMPTAESMPEIVDEIRRLDHNDDEYIARLSRPWHDQSQSMERWERKLNLFFDNIFNQPVDKAIRRTNYGFNRNHTDTIRAKARYYSLHRFAKKTVKKLIQQF